jgi:hypothetical protein
MVLGLSRGLPLLVAELPADNKEAPTVRSWRWTTAAALRQPGGFMILGIDPKVDYAFKRLFGREQNVALLISLLNAVLQPT